MNTLFPRPRTSEHAIWPIERKEVEFKAHIELKASPLASESSVLVDEKAIIYKEEIAEIARRTAALKLLVSAGGDDLDARIENDRKFLAQVKRSGHDIIACMKDPELREFLLDHIDTFGLLLELAIRWGDVILDDNEIRKLLVDELDLHRLTDIRELASLRPSLFFSYRDLREAIMQPILGASSSQQFLWTIATTHPDVIFSRPDLTTHLFNPSSPKEIARNLAIMTACDKLHGAPETGLFVLRDSDLRARLLSGTAEESATNLKIMATRGAPTTASFILQSQALRSKLLSGSETENHEILQQISDAHASSLEISRLCDLYRPTATVRVRR